MIEKHQSMESVQTREHAITYLSVIECSCRTRYAAETTGIVAGLDPQHQKLQDRKFSFSFRRGSSSKAMHVTFTPAPIGTEAR